MFSSLNERSPKWKGLQFEFKWLECVLDMDETWLLRYGNLPLSEIFMMCNSSLWTYTSKTNTDTDTVTEQADCVARNNVLDCFQTKQCFQGRCGHTIRLRDKYCSEQHQCTCWKAKSDAPSTNDRTVQVGMDPLRSPNPPLLNPPVQAQSPTARCPGPCPRGFLISPRMETPQPLWQPVPVLSHLERKVSLLRNEFSNQFSFF